MAENMKFGYVRVSTKEQNEARQMKAMLEAGVAERNIYVDKQSGKDFDRDGYNALIRTLRRGDEVYFASLDRMGRNYEEIAKEWERINKEIGADIVVLDMSILDTRQHRDLTGVLISDIVLKLLSYVAQIERDKIRTRQAEGIAIAKAEGKYRGRKPVAVDKVLFEQAYGKVVSGEWTNRYAMKHIGLKPNTYYKFVKEFNTKTGQWAEE